MIDKAPLQRAIDGATTPVYPTSFREIAQGFKVKFDGHWTRELAKASGLTPRTIQRYEQFVTGKGGQARNPDKARTGKAGLAAAGRTLDPIRREAPAKGLTFTVTFQAKEDKSHAPRERTFTVRMDHAEATKFVASPSYDDLFDDWFDGGADAYGDDGDYEAGNVQVSAA